MPSLPFSSKPTRFWHRYCTARFWTYVYSPPARFRIKISHLQRLQQRHLQSQPLSLQARPCYIYACGSPSHPARIGATGSHLPHPTELSGPGSKTPLRLIIIERELVNHPDKAFVKQLILNLVHGYSVGLPCMVLNLQLTPNTSVRPYGTLT